MKTNLIIFMTAFSVTAAMAANPFFSEYKTPHGTIPFNEIKVEHYMPAFEKAIAEQKEEINAIVNNSAAPTFENTIVALDRSGRMLSRVSTPFYNLLGAETSDELQALAQKISPIMTEHSNSINLNEKLFERVKSVYEQKDELKLTAEQQMLLKKTYDGFARKGANLSEADKEIYRELSKDLSLLSLQFSQNSLKETNNYGLHITDKALLAGLPNFVLEMLAEEAKKVGKDGYLITLRATSYVPVMRYADNRDLRRELFTANGTKCLNGEFDNRQITKDIANKRLKLANLLGYKTFADYALENRMAETTPNVQNFLDRLLEAFQPSAIKELAELQDFADRNGAYFKLQPWDWTYYSEKLKEEKFDLNDEMLKPYFELEKAKKAVFDLTTRLYGLTYKKNEKIQVYHPEVEAFEVFDEKGKFLAVLYTDFHPREGKRSGAWMSEFKGQWIDGKNDSRPHITIVMNFTRPTATTPALLTFDEFTTFLHEFGHALHGMLSKCTYESISGTSVYRDFVELPSHLLENWAWQKEYLDGFAVHYETGERMPAELMQRIRDAQNFNVGYFYARQLSFGYLDMAWHTLEQPFEGDVVEFEQAAMSRTQVLPLVYGTAMSPTFSHIFSGGYAAGYYSYNWAKVLVADAFSVFEKNGIFNKKTARSFCENILMRGGTEHPMILYKRFRGQEPKIDALLKESGVK